LGRVEANGDHGDLGNDGEQCYLKLAYVVLSGALSRKASLMIFCQSHRSIREAVRNIEGSQVGAVEFGDE
jgi:hypothetical protein